MMWLLFISSTHSNMGLALPLEEKRLTILLAVLVHTVLLLVSNYHAHASIVEYEAAQLGHIGSL